MPDDIIAIRVRLAGGKEVAFEARAAAEGVESIGNAAQTSAAKTRAAAAMQTGALARISAAGQRLRTAGQTMTYGVTLPLVGLGIAAIKTAADFERSMAQVRVATGLPESQMKQMSDLALQLGADTIFSANDAAQAMLELAKGGMTATQIRGGALAATMNLAAAGGIELADAAVQISGAMNTFGVKAGQASRIADALAGAANSSSANLSDLSMAFQQTGQQAAASGLSIYETAGAMAAFADQGLKGSDAGTSFKTFLQRLTPQSEKAKTLMRQLGLEFFNSQGKMRSLPEIAGQLEKAFRGMTQEQRLAAMQTLFGSDSIRAANILYREGASGLEKYIGAARERGTAEEMANEQMKGLPGAIEKLKGAWETTSKVIGDRLAPLIFALAVSLGFVMDKFQDLPVPVQTALVGLAGLAAIAGPTMWALGGIAGGVGNLIRAYRWFSNTRGGTMAANWIGGFTGKLRAGAAKVKNALLSLLRGQTLNQGVGTAADGLGDVATDRMAGRMERPGRWRRAAGVAGRFFGIAFGLAAATAIIHEIDEALGRARLTPHGIENKDSDEGRGLNLPGTSSDPVKDVLDWAGLGGQRGGPVSKMGRRGPRDTVLRWLDPREYVIRREAVDRLGAGTLAALNRGQMPMVRPLAAGAGAVSSIEPLTLGGLGAKGDTYVHTTLEVDGRVLAETTAKHSEDAEARA